MKALQLLLIGFLFQSSFVFSQDAKDKKDWAPLTVIVTDFENNIQKGEQILFVDAKTGTTYKGVTDASGKFDIKIPGGVTYDIKIKSFGEAADYNSLEIPALGENEIYTQMQLTIQIEQAKTITLDNVFFDTGKATLTKASFKELDELVEFMKLKEELKIELAGHTDDVGAEEPNLKLSQARADAVKRYLVSKGISSSRVVAKGYGEGLPVASNDTAEGRQKNRRTEVRIL
jgi:outer membrane protein OmpA-like peptidoglycan-associated protein